MQILRNCGENVQLQNTKYKIAFLFAVPSYILVYLLNHAQINGACHSIRAHRARISTRAAQ